MPAARKPAVPKPLRALSLRIAGADYNTIAQTLSVKVETAEDYVAEELEKLQRPNENTAHLDLARLNEMLTALWKKVREGDVQAIREAKEIMDRIRTLEAQAPKEESELDRIRKRRAERLQSGA